MLFRFNEVAKANKGKIALQQLRRFLDSSEPALVRFLYRTWDYQQRAITYKELREAIMSARVSGGNLDEYSYLHDLLSDWHEDYSRFVNEKISPAWDKSMRTAVNGIKGKIPGWFYSNMESGIQSYIGNAGGAFITNISSTQMEALKHVIRRSALMNEMSVDYLAHVIRPMVGLTKPQAQANFNYFTHMIENGIPKKTALERSLTYSARQNRYRAYDIARTELAYAYNHGEDMAIRQAQKDGFMGEVEKQWVTAGEERVCPVCGELDNTTVGMEQEFDIKTKSRHLTIKLPPAHPKCRCVVIYIEINKYNNVKNC